ncbi:hypothetical protein BD413DRAFT_559491 [Trametes elegans]|nr:hypothetical protein BD413DRAFT_559491 [Trametes elegans]
MVQPYLKPLRRSASSAQPDQGAPPGTSCYRGRRYGYSSAACGRSGNTRTPCTPRQLDAAAPGLRRPTGRCARRTQALPQDATRHRQAERYTEDENGALSGLARTPSRASVCADGRRRATPVASEAPGRRAHAMLVHAGGPARERRPIAAGRWRYLYTNHRIDAYIHYAGRDHEAPNALGEAGAQGAFNITHHFLPLAAQQTARVRYALPCPYPTDPKYAIPGRLGVCTPPTRAAVCSSTGSRSSGAVAPLSALKATFADYPPLRFPVQA